MTIPSSSQNRTCLESLKVAVSEVFAPFMGRLEMWTPPVFDETGVQPNFLCIGSVSLRRISVIQVCYGINNSVHLWQPSSIGQLSPIFPVSHELNFNVCLSIDEGNKAEIWDLLTSWLVDNQSISGIEKRIEKRRVAWRGGDMQAYDIAKSIEIDILRACLKRNLLLKVDILGAVRNYGRVSFPVSVDVVSLKHNRLATVVVEDVRPTTNFSYWVKNLSEYDGFNGGELSVNEQLIVYPGWSGTSWGEGCWEESIQHIVDWLS